MSALVVTSISYLVGSIPFGLVGTTIFAIQDPRTFGSKNIGATNILRSGNKKAAAFTLFFDMLKGYFVVFIAYCIDPELMYLAIISVVLGHIFPLYLLFKGGKGIATFLGALLSYSTIVGSIILFTWITVFYFTKKSSLAGLSSVILSNFFLFFLCEDTVVKLSVLFLSLLIIFKHSDNIKRLFKKEELTFEGPEEN